MSARTPKTMSLPVALSFADTPRPRATMQAPADTEDELRMALTVLAAAYRSAVETIAGGYCRRCGTQHRRAFCPDCGLKLIPVDAHAVKPEIFPCTYLGCKEPDGSKCRHWPRGSEKASERP